MCLPDESPSMPVVRLVELAQAAEDLGYTTAWLPDHVLPPNEYGAVFGGVYEPLITIGHLAAVTSRLRFGTSVLILPLRDPFVTAKQVATLQELSAGRMILGVGTGWNEQEFTAVGADHSRRGAITDDALAVLRHLLTGGTAPYRARRFSYDTGVFAPVPGVSVPVMVGGNSNAALRRAARHGDIWQGLPASPDDFAERVSTLARLAAGRKVVPAVRLGWEEGSSVDDLAERTLAYRAAGAEQLALHLGAHDTFLARMEQVAHALAGSL